MTAGPNNSDEDFDLDDAGLDDDVTMAASDESVQRVRDTVASATGTPFGDAALDDRDDLDDAGLDDEVTMAASDESVQRVRDAVAGATKTAAPERPGGFESHAASAGRGVADIDDGLTDEPTVIRGFGDEPTVPLKKQAPAPAKPAAGGSARTTIKTRTADRTASLIGDASAPTSSTAFFELNDLAPEQLNTDRITTRSGRYPLWLLGLAVLIVAVTVTVVLLVVLGTSGGTP